MSEKKRKIDDVDNKKEKKPKKAKKEYNLHHVLSVNECYGTLEKIPEDITKFKNLRKINYTFNLINSIDDFIDVFKKLEILILKGNSIKKIPSSLYTSTYK